MTNTREKWADAINSDWRKYIDTIIQTGISLLAAKDQLTRGEFDEMTRNDLDFSPGKAYSIMQIAAHPILGNSAPAENLPPNWTVLAALSGLSKANWKWAERRGHRGGQHCGHRGDYGLC